jgi:hypothetical protein
VKFKEMKDMEIVDSKVLDAYLNILSKQDRIDEMISIATQYDFYPSIEILTKMHRQKDISEYLWRDAKVAKLVLGIPVLKVESDVLKTHNHFTKLFSEYKKVRLQSRKRCRSTDPITGP